MTIQDNTQREQMIRFITRVIQELDDRKLSNVYHLVLHIR